MVMEIWRANIRVQIVCECGVMGGELTADGDEIVHHLCGRRYRLEAAVIEVGKLGEGECSRHPIQDGMLHHKLQ